MKSDKIRILIVDDHPAMRAGLRALITSEIGMEVAAECGDGSVALDAYRVNHPDVVLMDLRMPILGGVEATKRSQTSSILAKMP